jgi:YidC/Oxa1 family membrane protein insertase
MRSVSICRFHSSFVIRHLLPRSLAVEQRRVIAFLLLSFAIVMFFRVLFPGPNLPPQQPPAGAQAGEDKDGAEGKDRDKAAVEAAAQPQAADRFPQLADVEAPAKYLTLGSLDPESGYRMLVTLSTAGASVRRAEMSSPRYTDQHDRAGYMGELELAQAESGGRVQAVGAGTPAAKAGLQVGDVIQSAQFAAQEPISAKTDIEALYSQLKPGEQVELLVQRGEEPPKWLTVTLARRPFAVVRPEIENFRMRDEEPPPDFVDRPSFLLMLAGVGDKRFEGQDLQRITTLLEKNEVISPDEREQLAFAKRLAAALEGGHWQVEQPDENTVQFTRPLAEMGLKLVKRYRLEPVPAEHREDVDYPGYHLRLEIEVHNTGDAPQTLAYRLDGPTGMPTEGWWYASKVSHGWASAGLRDIAVRFDGGSAIQIDCVDVAEGDVKTMEGSPLVYAGVDGQYFSAVLIPQRAKPADDWLSTTEAIIVGPKPDPRKPKTYTNVTTRLTGKSFALAAGESRRDSYQVFLGPKRPDLLANYQPDGDANYSLSGLIYYGWYGGIARVMLWILHFFYGIVQNYGVAIVMLTVLVRGALFPLSIKQTRNMARMQALKPEMDRINEKYKDDMQKRSEATRELYRKHQINPLGGCLPMLLQLPIFVGLYRALMIDVELRNSPLLGHAIHWCSNLAAPDMLFDWSGIMPRFVNSGIGIFGLGPYFNLLPIITVGLFLVTQKMTMPPPTNEQAAMQQKMMKYMLVFFGLLFYKVASGLCLYFIASSLWGIAERKLLKNVSPPDTSGPGAASVPARVSPKPDRNGSPAQKKKRAKNRRRG